MSTQPMAGFGQVRRLRAHELVVAQVQQRILGGDLPVGSRLPAERRLVEELGVSRATLREGLRVAESMGLVEIRQGEPGGARVIAALEHGIRRSLDALHDTGRVTSSQLIEVCALLERAVAGEGARRIAAWEDDLAVAWTAFDRASDGDPGAAERSFYLALCAGSGNPALAVLATGARAAVGVPSPGCTQTRRRLQRIHRAVSDGDVARSQRLAAENAWALAGRDAPRGGRSAPSAGVAPR